MVNARDICPSRILIITGHYGAGKTECAVNLALGLADAGEKTVLADLDIVNPYFRSRERKALLQEHGVRVITSSQACSDADVPSIPAELHAVFEDRSLRGVLDVGGDPSGARVLARYRRALAERKARLLCVINANRPLSDTADKCIDYVRRIEAACGMAVDGLVNNTHCCHLTEVADVLSGAEMAREVSEKTGIGVLCHCVPRHLYEEAAAQLENVFPMDLYMKKPWE